MSPTVAGEAAPHDSQIKQDAVVVEVSQPATTGERTTVPRETASSGRTGDDGDQPVPALESWLKRHKRVAEMLEKDDWVSVWIGVSTFVVLAVASALEWRVTFVPRLWSQNPLKSFESTSAFRTSSEQKVEMQQAASTGDVMLGLMWLLAMLPGMLLPLTLCAWRMVGGKQKFLKLLPGFCALFFLALLGRLLGAQSSLKSAGIGATVWTLILGMLLSNVVARFLPLTWMEPAAKLAEFYIKVGLVLLAVEFTTIGKYGVGGLVVAWGVTPVCVAVIYRVGVKYLAPSSTHSLVVLMACGISVCGGSAITACASAIKAPQDEQALAISIVSFFTIFFMLALPYAALALGIDLNVAAAWIGGSVNNTGNVVASVAILDNSSQRPDGLGPCPGPGCPGEMGPVIKMSQNAILGVVVVGVTVYWLMFEEADADQSFVRLSEPAEEGGGKGAAMAERKVAPLEVAPGNNAPYSPSEGAAEERAQAQAQAQAQAAGGAAGGGARHERKGGLKWPTAMTLWDRFPKFVLGFLCLSAAVTGMAVSWMGEESRGGAEAPRRPLDDLLGALDEASDWWFYVGFVGIGVNTDLRKMVAKLKGGSVVVLYLAGQTFNVAVTLLVAWLVF